MKNQKNEWKTIERKKKREMKVQSRSIDFINRQRTTKITEQKSCLSVFRIINNWVSTVNFTVICMVKCTNLYFIFVYYLIEKTSETFNWIEGAIIYTDKLTDIYYGSVEMCIYNWIKLKLANTQKKTGNSRIDKWLWQFYIHPIAMSTQLY